MPSTAVHNQFYNHSDGRPDLSMSSQVFQIRVVKRIYSRPEADKESSAPQVRAMEGHCSYLRVHKCSLRKGLVCSPLR